MDLFFSTIHGSRSLKDHYYLNGVGGGIELEFELAVCEELGFDSSSEDCIKYLRCRYGKSAMCTSYSMTAESSVIPVVPKDAPKKIVVEYLGAEQIPNMLVHVEVDGHVFVFSRVADKDVAIQFGHLALVELDGQDIMPPPVALMEVFNSDPCRRILLDKQ
ncbi:hypothetical protein [Pseudodesulfovibrio portus]|uniref:hypothetical protein n=1 Tax=Pseudodesulfovibrio portus TaxID=231439 RepID=UPI00222E2E51|nr:hypothetical protein [Pseudodesulfovibrio portus]